MMGVPIRDPKTPPYRKNISGGKKTLPLNISLRATYIANGECATSHILDGQFIITRLSKMPSIRMPV